jgi:hypothetical protein
MRHGITLAATLIVASTTDASAQQWCGYFGHSYSLIQCGYSTLDACKIAVGTGKDATCYANPDETVNSRDRAHFLAAKH